MPRLGAPPSVAEALRVVGRASGGRCVALCGGDGRRTWRRHGGGLA